MTRRRLLLCIMLAVAAARAALASSAMSAPVTSPGSYAPHRVIVKLKPSLPRTDADAVRGALSAHVRAQFKNINAEVWDIAGVSVDDAVKRLKADPRVEFVEPDYLVRASAVFPLDPQFPQQWSLHNSGQSAGKVDADIDAPEAWITTSGAPVLVGVIDSGVDFDHEDLKGSIFTNTGEIPGNGIDDDGNGYADDVHGWDFVNQDNSAADDNGHGTHVSGLIAAPGDNGIGMAGVCWSARVLPLKFLDQTGSGATSDAILALQYAVRMGARVVNLSWGSFLYSSALHDALLDAENHGVLCVAASGNDGLDASLFPVYPASYELDNIVSVASTDRNDALSLFSDYGSTVDLAAPGSDIVSAYPGNRYVRLSGTSMSSAIVSGAACLLWSRAPFMTEVDMKAALVAAVDHVPALDGKTRAGGRLNLQRLMSAVDATPPAALTTLAVDAIASNAVRLAWTAPGDDSAAGSASMYEMRYSTTPITAGNFNAAKLAAGLPHPLLAGSAQSFEVAGLFFNTKYFFALVAIDEAGNRSTLSNIVNATTQGTPGLDVAPDAFSANLPTGGTATRSLSFTNNGVGTLDFSVQVAPAWARLIPASGRVAAGQSLALKVVFDAAHLAGGHYDSSLIMATNDPSRSNVPLAVSLQVNDAPDISTDTATLDFGTGFAGACAQRALVVTNNGTSTLNVGSATAPEAIFAAATTPFVLAPGETRTVPVFFCPAAAGKMAGTLSIPSNDPDHPVLTIALLGRGAVPPVVHATPPAISVDLYVGATAERTISLSNTGGSDLDYVVSVPAPETISEVASASSPASAVIASGRPIGRDALREMQRQPVSREVDLRGGKVDRDARSSSPPGSAPADATVGDNRFTEVFGSATNMYFGSDIMRGNIFKCTATTNLKEYRFFLNAVESTELWFVVYESDSKSGLYSIAAASNLSPSASGPGWYSSGEINLHMVRNRYYLMAATFLGETGYFNQSNIAPYPIATSFGTLVAGAGWSWAPFTVFPPSGYQGVPPEAFGAQVAYYQAVVTDGVVRWLSMAPEKGTVRRGGAVSVRLDIDATGLAAGNHDAVIRVSSNDPSAPNVDIPVHLHVNGGADIALPSGPVDLGDCFTGVAATDTLLVTNAGTQFLNVSHLACNNADFTVTPASLFLGIGAIEPVIVSFKPKSVGAETATLSITSDDPDEPVSTVTLRGNGRRPPHVSVATSAMSETVGPGGTRTRTLSIVNTGESALNFELRAEKPGPSSPVGKKIVPGQEGFGAPSRSGAAVAAPHSTRSYSGRHDVPGATARVFPKSPQTTGAHGLRVLALYTGDAFEILDDLTLYSDVAQLDGFNAEFDVPTLADLAPYDAVFMYNDFVFADPNATGDALADYVDGGGSVIVTLAAFVSPYDVHGRFAGAAYLPFTIGTGPQGSSVLGEYDAAHPIMAGVGFAAGELLGNTTLVSAARLVASWNDGRPLIATNHRGQVVGINAYLGDGGYWSGDFPLLVHNALMWSTGVPWLSASPPRGLVAPHEHMDVTINFDAGDLTTGNYAAVLRVVHNDPLAHDVEIPVSIAVDSTSIATGVGDAPLPSRYALEANHPNPFNPVTTVAYDLAGPGRSRLVVYDVNGARIRELVNMFQRAGHYTVTWDGRDGQGAPVASGVYFYRLTSGPFNETRKMVLLK